MNNPCPTPIPSVPEIVPSGSIALDLALGVGGFPRGRIVEIYGPESSGKTTLALHAIAEAQKTGGTAAFIDVEHALDPNYAAALGVDLDNLLVSQPDNGEQALEIVEALIRSSALDVVVQKQVMETLARIQKDLQAAVILVGHDMGLMAQFVDQGAGAKPRLGQRWRQVSCTVVCNNRPVDVTCLL